MYVAPGAYWMPGLSASFRQWIRSIKRYIRNVDAEYLAEALTENEIASGSDSEYGLFITTVDGETADDGEQQWWCITKGGEMLMTGASETPVADGETYELTLTTGY